MAITGILKLVEFKQPTRQARRSTLNIPQRDGSSIVVFHTTHSKATKPSFTSRLRNVLLSKPALISLAVIIGVATVVLIRGVTGGDSNQTAQTPTYKTVLPEKKSANELGGWKRISPPGKEAVFAYADTLDGVPISVSQQPLPKGDVAEIAQKFNATDKVDAGSITVYVGTSSKGPQSVIFAKNNVLVLIKSEKKIENTSWATYAQSLN